MITDVTNGDIEFQGRNLSYWKKHRKEYYSKVQMIWQDPYSSINPKMRIKEIIARPLKNFFDFPKEELDKRLHEIIKKVGLTESHLDMYPHELSGGGRQRTIIARALISEPILLIADEPTSALDVSIQAQILNLMKTLKEEMSLSMVFISHDISVVNFLCDTICVMYMGRIMEQAPRDALIHNHKHWYTTLLFESIPKGPLTSERQFKVDLGELEACDTGCPFAPRCIRADAICFNEKPEMEMIGKNHICACHHHRYEEYVMESKLALFGGPKAIQGTFPSWPIWSENEKSALARTLDSGVWGVLGDEIPKFCESFANLIHVKHALTVFNGTVALVVALESLGVGPGDEVIIPDYTFMATAVAPLKVGAKPVLVDVDPKTFCIDPDKIEKAITERTKAIIPVHLCGNICDMDRIGVIAKEHNLKVIEDSAHAHGSRKNGRYAGTFGDVGTFSFQSSKTLTCGEGGAVVTNDDKIMNLLFSYHNCGRPSFDPDYNHVLPGNNFRMSQFQAAVLNAQLEKFSQQLKIRDRNGRLLTELLEKIDGVMPQKRADGLEVHGHYLFTFMLDKHFNRTEFKKALAAEGYLVQLEYPAIHTLGFMRPYVDDLDTYPVSEALADHSIWMYHNALLGTEEQVYQMAEAVKKVAAYYM
jgi:3-amino-5-hydroxybenzoate synthase